MSSPSSPAQLMCSICLDDLTAFSIDNKIHLCPDKSHSPCCKDCMVSYIENAISSAYLGTCPQIFCPDISHTSVKESNTVPVPETSLDSMSVGKKRRKILIYDDWKHLISSESANKYNQLANSLLAFLCGGCHSLKTLDVGYDNESSHTYLINHFGISSSSGIENSNTTFSDFQQQLKSYIEGTISLDEFYQKILSTYIPELGSINDKDAWDIFINILKMISDPERRANLHLRYLRDRPRIKTGDSSNIN